jgi:hypothetical protein
VTSVLTEGLFAPANNLPGLQIRDFLEIAVVRAINDLDLAHPATRFTVEVIAGEAHKDGLTFPATLEFVLKAAVQSQTVARIHTARLPAPQIYDLQEWCPHTPIVADGDPAR